MAPERSRPYAPFQTPTPEQMIIITPHIHKLICTSNATRNLTKIISNYTGTIYLVC